MKTVYLIRHGKAEPRGTGIPDFNRALVEDGIEISRLAAERLKKEGVEPSVLISSPAQRAYETACAFAKVFNYRIKLIRSRKSLYDSNNCAQFLEIIQLLDDTYDNAFIFGHNPTISDFALFLDLKFKEDIPKSGIVGIEFDVQSWKDINGGSGKTVLFDPAKETGNKETKKDKKSGVNKDKKEETDKIAAEISEHIKKFIDSKDNSVSSKMKKIICRTAGEIAKKFAKEKGNR